MLKSQTAWDSADRPVDDTNGNMEDIGGEVCTWGGVTLTVSVDGEACAMAGETKATKMPDAPAQITTRDIWCGKYISHDHDIITY